MDKKNIQAENKKKKTNNPLATPTAKTDTLIDKNMSSDAYDILIKKINQRMEFITTKLSYRIIEIITYKLADYWTGGKLAKINRHRLWSIKSFTEGSCHLKHSLHLVVLCLKGKEAYETAFLGLPFSHKSIGYPNLGCSGTFLTNQEDIDRYLKEEPLKEALHFDLEIAIERLYHNEPSIEYLSHTKKDVREETVFVCFDDDNGNLTRQVREVFPINQIVTIVKGYSADIEDTIKLFSLPEQLLTNRNLLNTKQNYQGKGFYQGQTFFLPDFSSVYEGSDLFRYGYIFGTIGALAHIGPDYGGMVWGSKGGADGAVRAARALYGTKGAQSDEDLRNAIRWADD